MIGSSKKGNIAHVVVLTRRVAIFGKCHMGPTASFVRLDLYAPKVCIHSSNNNFSVLEQLGGKTLVMSLLTHADPNVRYEALLAVQKLMVHNW